MKWRRHLAHADSFRDNPIVFITTCTARRRKLLACSEVHEILRGIWMRSAEHDGWWVGHYILMPDHVHLFARPEIDASLMANWMLMWKSVSSRRIAAALSFKPPIWQLIISTAISVPLRAIPINGSMQRRTPYALDSSGTAKRGRTAGQFTI